MVTWSWTSNLEVTDLKPGPIISLCFYREKKTPLHVVFHSSVQRYLGLQVLNFNKRHKVALHSLTQYHL